MTTNTNLSNMLHTFQGDFPLFPGNIPPAWLAAAQEKGFDIIARLADRLHLALRCRRCGTVNKVKLFTLRTAQPLCHACIAQEWQANATAAGLTFLHRDPLDRHYGLYSTACSHVVRRQFELVSRISAGQTGLRCEICHAATEAGEASARGWTLTGPDPEHDPNYRIYHHDACGHSQRIARANMQTGRHACGGCHEGWSTSPSYIYLMHFTLATSRPVIKLGYSRDPVSRLAHQLRVDPAMPCEIIRQVAMPSGHAAIRAEKAMHSALKRAHPEAIVDPASWRGQIKVKSEIYDEALLPVILGMLDGIIEHDLAA